MTNAFDSASYPTREPATLVAGDRWAWKRPDLSASYPTASYALTYVARLEGTGATAINITAGETGGEYVVEVASATTAGYTAGTYRWTAYVTRSADSERVQVGEGTWTVTPNRATATTDPRSAAKIMLDKIESILAGRADADVASYSIAGRSLSKIPIPELIAWRDNYKREVVKEQQAERIAAGLGSGRKVAVRFTSW
ncbi:MAG: hypothetical protein RIS35_3709 [Pseudomonadota bacterium]|jgi:hypothetical protein